MKKIIELLLFFVNQESTSCMQLLDKHYTETFISIGSVSVEGPQSSTLNVSNSCIISLKTFLTTQSLSAF